MTIEQVQEKIKDPCKRYLTASFQLSSAEVENLFRQMPWCEVIVFPNGSWVVRPEGELK